MVKKIGRFIFGLGLIIIIQGIITLTSYPKLLHIKCGLQNDATYTCQATHEFWGYELNKLEAVQVTGVDIHATPGCNSNKNHSCPGSPYFLTTSGEEIRISSTFTGYNANNLIELVNSDIQSQKPTIDQVGKDPIGMAFFFGINVCSIIVFFIVLLVILLRLRAKKP